MPQAPRKDATAQRAQDKESKRARGALSCAECRRLKLKCDKTVPCSSCKRRGCSAICPNGSLITGQGTRFVLADTEKLHQKIAQMSDRIRQLEDALAILQSSQTRDQHPLLHRDLLKIKSSIELHSAVDGEDGPAEPEEVEESQYIDAFGTLAIRDDGAATFYGRSAGSESLLMGEVNSPRPEIVPHNGNNSPRDAVWQPDLPPSITNLSSSFPLSSNDYQSGIDLNYLISSFLPPWQEACRLCELYLEQAPWFFGAVTKRQLHEEILPLWYQEAPKSTLVSTPPSEGQSPISPGLSTSSAASTKGGAHELALLFIIFCFGALTDISLPPAPDNPDAKQYIQLTKAALTLEPVLDRPPSVATVQTLSLMAIYEGLCSGENSIESTWALMGLSTKLAQSIGLHRDCARWKLAPAEVQKRRALFWELFITDCWQSLATGRLATFSLPFVDCELPSDPDQTIADDGSIQPSFPFWKARFGAECVSAVVQGTLTSRAPKYSIILELDRKVRDMELPKYAQGPPPQGLGLSQTMSHFMPINYRELTLLYIHRCFFAHAISSHPTDPIKSQYAPSFLAGYRSACELLESVKVQFSLFPAQIARFWVLWTHAFSSAVMLSSVVTHSSKSKVAPAALLELRTACELFEKAAAYGGRAVKFLPIVKRLQAKAQQVYLETHSGIPPAIANDIFAPSQGDETKDEMSIFSGKTHTLSTKVNPPTRPSRPSPQQSPASSASRSASDSPKNYTNNPSFAGVHPHLANQLHGFESHINTQIQNAYYSNQDSFASTLMGTDYPQIQHQPQEPQVQHPPQNSMQPQEQQHQHLQHQAPLHQQQHQQQVQQPQHQPQLFHQQQQQQHQLHQLSYANVPSDHHVPVIPAPVPIHHRHSLVQARSHPNLQASYNQYQPQPQPQHPHRHHHPHQTYDTTPVYMHHSGDNTMHSSPTGPQYPSPESVLESNPQPQSATSQYWANNAPTSYYQNPEPRYSSSHPHQPMQQHYTPDAALRGIAAEDRGLQETWQSYMYKVGSPRHIFED